MDFFFLFSKTCFRKFEYLRAYLPKKITDKKTAKFLAKTGTNEFVLSMSKKILAGNYLKTSISIINVICTFRNNNRTFQCFVF